jgi:hypothetical protein
MQVVSSTLMRNGMPVRRRRDGTFFVRLGWDRTLGPYPTRGAAQAAQIATRKKDIEDAVSGQPTTMRVQDHTGGWREVTNETPVKLPGPGPVRAFMSEGLVEMPGLPFVFNRWAIVAGPIALLILFSPKWGGWFSPFYYFSFASLSARAIIAAVLLSFASPLVWRPIAEVLWAVFKVLARVAEAIWAVLTFVGRIAAAVLGWAIVAGIITVVVLVIRTYLKSRQ